MNRPPSLPLSLFGATLVLLSAAACRERARPGGSPGVPGPLPRHTACSGLPLGAGTQDRTLTHAGHTRRYRLHVPPGYDPTRPTAVVLSFHGYGSDEQQQEALSGLSREADARGFLAVYPQWLSQGELGQDPGREGPRAWNAGPCCGAARDTGADDVGFVDALLADLDTRVCLDSRRVYSTGFSNGGFFSYRLACERSEVFAAIAPVAGVEGHEPCSPTRAVPVMHFHGTDDQTILYGGGTHPLLSAPTLSASTSVERWATRNGCTGAPRTTFQQGDSTCVTSESCRQEALVTLCTVQGGGHTWPGGLELPALGHTTRDLDATREMWRFFSAHPRP